MLKRTLAITGMMMWLVGCQTTPFLMGSSDQSDTSVMSLWKTYTHCRSSTDSTVMAVDARELNAAAQQFTVPKPSPIRLPAVLTKHVVEQAPRYSVDPNAMSASCSLYAGHAALRAGRTDVAREMFHSILQGQSGTGSTYYVDQARAGMRKLHTTILVSGPKTSPLIPVSSTKTTR